MADEGKPTPKEPDETVISFDEMTLRAPTPPGAALSRSEQNTEPAVVRGAMSDPERLLNQYVLVARVGSGGMGTVWKAWDRKLARWVAIKFLNTTEEEHVRRFQREAQIAAQLRHPNIAAIFEVNEAKGRPFIVMEFIDGGSLDKPKFELKKLLEVFVKVCRAIDAAHKKGIVHRDIKPGNIMVSNDGTPYVTDFGLARAQDSSHSLSLSGQVMGTPAYMPPEQARGKLSQVDAQSDVYSLGATLYALVTGRPPFEAENPMGILLKVCNEDPFPPRRIRTDVPLAIEAVVLKAMEKDKARRYASAGDLAEDLQRFLDDREVLAKPLSGFGRLVRRIQRNPWPFAAAVVLMLAVGAVGSLTLTAGPTQGGGPKTLEQAWTEEWEGLRGALAFDSPAPAPNELRRVAEHLKAVPESCRTQVSEWLDNQLTHHVPATRWAKAQWPEQQDRARRIVSWAGMVEGALPRDTFREVGDRLAARAREFAVVADYRGKITLKIYALPFARLQALKVGGQAVIEGGRVVEGADIRVSGTLETPLTLHDLDIGAYELVLVDHEGNAHTLALQGDGFERGATYLYAGSVKDGKMRCRKL